MSFIKINPITWRIHRLKCDCGGEFEHKFNVSYAEKPRTHVCNRCDAIEDHEYVYPRTVWEDEETMSLTMNQRVREILK